MTSHRLSNVRVGRRLGLAFGAVGTLVLVSAGAGLSAVGEQRDLAEQVKAVEGVVQDAETARFQIAENITGVSTAADSTTQALTQTRTAVDELSRMAADLRTNVSRFTY